MAGLHFVNTVDNAQALSALNGLKLSFQSVEKTATDTGLRIDEFARKLASLSGITIGVAGLKELVNKAVEVRGEFQQLEIAFGTMLGSADKANKLMTQLTKTAATTPFDLTSVSNGAKQLLAFGISADEVNKTLIDLGDIAAGLSIPLNDMVYLYGTTMVQGRMFTQDLRQFQSRGIPIAEELAKVFGVTAQEVGDLVTAGKVGAKEFQQAMQAMVSEGGKFGGLMEAQSKSISGQISNIEDGIDMMFNEIGKSSEGAIDFALSGISTLVENYKIVGTAILALAGTYGVYKTSLVIVSAVEKAHKRVLEESIVQKKLAAMSNITLSNSDVATAARKQIFTSAIKKNTTALLKNTAAMLTNPAVLITAGILALCAAVWKVSNALDTQARAQERVNEAQGRSQKKLDEAKQATDEAIITLQSETATVYEKAKAYQTLQKYMPKFTAKYDQATIATMNLKDAQQEQAKEMENLEFTTKANEIEASKKKIKDYKKQQEALTQQMQYAGQGAAGLGIQIGILANKEKIEAEALAALQKEYNEMIKVRKEVEFNAKPIEEKIQIYTAQKAEMQERLDEWQRVADEEVAKAKEIWENSIEGNMKMQYQGITFEQEAGNNPAVLGLPYLNAASMVKTLQTQVEETQGKIDGLNKALDAKIDLSGLVKQITDAETALNAARKTYQGDANADNRKAVENAESTLKDLTDKYKDATGTVWYDTKKMYEDMATARQKAMNDRQRILNSSIQNERARREAEHLQQLKELNQEEAAYKKAHNGRTSSEFALRRENLEIQLDIDMKDFDRKFDEWKKDFERETLEIQLDTKQSYLENSLDLATNIADKINLQNQLYEEQQALLRRNNQIEADSAIKDKYGEQMQTNFRTFSANESNSNVLSNYSKAKSPEERRKIAKDAGFTEALLTTYKEMQEVYDQYADRLNATLQQAAQQHNLDILKQDIDDYEQYCQEIIDAAEWRKQQLAAISSGEEKNRTKEMVEADYNAMMKTSLQKHNIDAVEQNAAGVVTNLVQALSDVTYDQIDNVVTEFYNALDEQVKQIQSVKDLSSEERAGQAQETELQVSQLNTELENPLLDDEQRLALHNQLIEAEQKLVYLKMSDAQLDGELYKLEKTRQNVQTQVTNAKNTAGKKSIKEQKAEEDALNATISALGNVSSAAKAVGDTMGGALSKKAKKAVDTISEIADFGIQAIQSISSLVSGVSTSMQATSEGAASAISTIEKASVILTIISIAVQLIMKIVEIASKFTQSAQMQDAIDAQLEKVDELKRKNERLQRIYKSKVGTNYYKGMADAAKQYNEIIRAQNKALIQAQELYNLQKSKYKSDSDKVKDAKQQVEDIEDELYSLKDEQTDMIQEIRDSLLTTDLQSFSDSLADSLIEGFENGKEGIEDTWEDTLNELMRAMMKQQLSLALQNMFKSTFDKLNSYADDGELTQSKIDSIIAEMDAKSAQAEALAEQYYDLMDERGLLGDDVDNEGSRGGFESMSQDTADELNARFTALQIEGANVVVATQGIQHMFGDFVEADKIKQILLQNISNNAMLATQIAQNQLDQLRIIANNIALLQETNTRLKAIEQNTGKL